VNVSDVPCNPAESPADSAELAERVCRLAAAGTPIYPIGGGTGEDFGGVPSRPGVRLSLARLDRVIDHAVRDLTITVEAGVTLDRLTEALAAEGQRLAVDVPDAPRATVGGALAVNVAGPRQLRWGTFRDHVIGLTVVNDRGELCSAGGRVVKNVAGYDLPKLYIGSLGAFGIIAQVTFKLQPRPAEEAWVSCPVPAPAVADVLDRLHASAARPSAVELLNAAAGGRETTSEWTLHLLLEDAVEWQAEQLRRELTFEVEFASRPAELEEALVASPAVRDCPFSIQCGARPSALAALALALDRPGVRVHAHALSGVVRAGASNLELPEARELLTIARRHGHAVVRRCPADWQAALSVWGDPPPAGALLRRVKSHFDPAGILNPGRTAYG
jgi:glycolate oxidase FAD binding subunit